MSEITYRDLSFNKADRRVLLAKLEKYYAVQLKTWHFHTLGAGSTMRTKTQTLKIDRRFRTSIKCTEIMLQALGSEFMSNVKPQSIRQTAHIVGRSNGTLQSPKKIMDNFRKINKRKSD